MKNASLTQILDVLDRLPLDNEDGNTTLFGSDWKVSMSTKLTSDYDDEESLLSDRFAGRTRRRAFLQAILRVTYKGQVVLTWGAENGVDNSVMSEFFLVKYNEIIQRRIEIEMADEQAGKAILDIMF